MRVDCGSETVVELRAKVCQIFRGVWSEGRIGVKDKSDVVSGQTIAHLHYVAMKDIEQFIMTPS